MFRELGRDRTKGKAMLSCHHQLRVFTEIRLEDCFGKNWNLRVERQSPKKADIVIRRHSELQFIENYLFQSIYGFI